MVPLYIKVLALEEIGKQNIPARERILVENLQNVHALLASTAGKLLSQINPAVYELYFNRLAPAQQKKITTADMELSSKIAAFNKASFKNRIATGLLLPMVDAWIEKTVAPADADTSVSVVLLPMEGSRVQMPGENIAFHSNKTKVMVLKTTAFPQNCLVFREKAASLVSL